jgi:hypothetical protein
VKSVWYCAKSALIDTESFGIVKTQGFGTELLVSEHAAPVMFQPENVQLAAGVAVMFTACPTGSKHPDGHDG